MPTLVVIAYRDETSAATAGEQAQRLVRHLGDRAGRGRRGPAGRDGRFHLTTNHHPAAGEVSWGMVWMLVFALLFDRPSPGRGTRPAPAAASTALLELIAGSGVDERVPGRVRDRLDPGTSALFLALGTGQPDRVVEVLGPYGGEVLQTTMTAAGLAALREALHGGPAAASSRPSAQVETQLPGPDDRLAAGGDPQLPVDRVRLGLHRRVRHVQPARRSGRARGGSAAAAAAAARPRSAPTRRPSRPRIWSRLRPQRPGLLGQHAEVAGGAARTSSACRRAASAPPESPSPT